MGNVINRFRGSVFILAVLCPAGVGLFDWAQMEKWVTARTQWLDQEIGQRIGR